MKNIFTYIALLSTVVTCFFACTSADDTDETIRNHWNVSFFASKDSGDVVTRSLYIGGASGRSYVSLWDPSDVVYAYKDGNLIGTLKPVNTNVATTELTGAVTGDILDGDILNIYVIGRDVDYTGQTGSLADMTKFVYMESELGVEIINNSTITTNKIAFKSKQFYLRFQFMDPDGIRLPIEQLTIHADGGKLLQKKPINGDPVYGDIVVNTVKENGSYPIEIYVCMHNDLGTTDTYSFTIKSSGYVYSSIDDASRLKYNLKDGTYNRVARTLYLHGASSRITTTTTVDGFEDGGGDSDGNIKY